MEAADGDGDPCVPKRTCDVESARTLVRLNADECNKPEIVVEPKASEDRRDIDACVRFIDRLDVDGDIRPKDLPIGAIGCNSV